MIPCRFFAFVRVKKLPPCGFIPCAKHSINRRHQEIVETMTKGEVPVRDMGRVGKELGRLEAVLEKQAEVEEKTAEIQDLEEVRFGIL